MLLVTSPSLAVGFGFRIEVLIESQLIGHEIFISGADEGAEAQDWNHAQG